MTVDDKRIAELRAHWVDHDYRGTRDIVELLDEVVRLQKGQATLADLDEIRLSDIAKAESERDEARAACAAMRAAFKHAEDNIIAPRWGKVDGGTLYAEAFGWIKMAHQGEHGRIGRDILDALVAAEAALGTCLERVREALDVRITFTARADAEMIRSALAKIKKVLGRTS